MILVNIINTDVLTVFFFLSVERVYSILSIFQDASRVREDLCVTFQLFS